VLALTLALMLALVLLLTLKLGLQFGLKLALTLTLEIENIVVVASAATHEVHSLRRGSGAAAHHL
jgi:hypothetical protein